MQTPYSTQIVYDQRLAVHLSSRDCPRFFDQVGHQTTNASIESKYFFTKKCLCQTYHNYEQSRQKLGTFLVNKIQTLKIKYSSEFFFGKIQPILDTEK